MKGRMGGRSCKKGNKQDCLNVKGEWKEGSLKEFKVGQKVGNTQGWYESKDVGRTEGREGGLMEGRKEGKKAGW